MSDRWQSSRAKDKTVSLRLSYIWAKMSFWAIILNHVPRVVAPGVLPQSVRVARHHGSVILRADARQML